MWNTGSGSKKHDPFSGTSLAVRCYESHPILKMGKGMLYGGSASHPVIKDADIYVALQSGSTSGRVSDPWDPPKVVEVQYSIQDMHAPQNVARFKKMVTWLCNQLHDGKTIHVGCIGGHGRTGTLLSAVVAEMLEKKDAIQWVRKHYCKKAVESHAQVAFLMKHYDVSKAEPTKSEVAKWTPRDTGDNGPSKWSNQPMQRPLLRDVPISDSWPKQSSSKVKQIIPEGVTSKTKSFAPMSSGRSLWKLKKSKKS